MVMILLTLTGIYATVLFTYTTSAPRLGRSLLSKREATYLASSGIVRAEVFLNENISWTNNSYEENIPDYGSILLSCSNWGGYKRIISKGFRKRDSCVTKCIINRDVPATLSPSLVLTGSIGGLVVDFQTKIANGVVLNNGSVRLGKYKEPIAGSESWTTIQENDSLPFDEKPIQEILSTYSSQYLSTLGGGVAGLEITAETNLADTTIIQGNCTISSGELINKRIICHGTVTVGSSASLEFCEILAEEIGKVDGSSNFSIFYSTKGIELSGGKHESQFFSAQNIVITGGQFKPQSFILCRFSPDDTLKEYGVRFGKESQFLGTSISIADSGDGTIQRPSIVVDSSTVVRGYLITNGDIALKDCVIAGSIWARSLVTEEEGVIYKNWLFRTTLLANKEKIHFPLLGEPPLRLNKREIQ